MIEKLTRERVSKTDRETGGDSERGERLNLNEKVSQRERRREVMLVLVVGGGGRTAVL